MFNFTLTLPAIAGIVLTIGMAVDANVLIFERMKEEYPPGQVHQGRREGGLREGLLGHRGLQHHDLHRRASCCPSSARGRIQGFAVTLAVGVVSSMFTALFVSRLIYDFNTDVLRIPRLSLGWRRLAA